jgi:hypothetical protein
MIAKTNFLKAKTLEEFPHRNQLNGIFFASYNYYEEGPNKNIGQSSMLSVISNALNL